MGVYLHIYTLVEIQHSGEISLQLQQDSAINIR